MARQMRSGVAGISTWRTPNSLSASTIALMVTASAGVVPPSPAGRMPSGWVGVGTSLMPVSKNGNTSARHGVVHERGRQQLTGPGIVEALFQQRLADALHDAAMG